MSSRDPILSKLRAAQPSLQDITAPSPRRRVTPLDDHSPAALRARFTAEAETLACRVVQVGSAAEATAYLLGLLGDDTSLLSWDFAHLPLPGLAAALAAQGITVAQPGDGSVRVGLTGADAALAATGTLVLVSGPGRPRGASLLPEVHVAVVRAGQLMPDLEGWMAAQDAAALRQSANVVFISGPSRTADIGMELIMGAHGPAEVHILLLPDEGIG